MVFLEQGDQWGQQDQLDSQEPKVILVSLEPLAQQDL